MNFERLFIMYIFDAPAGNMHFGIKWFLEVSEDISWLNLSRRIADAAVECQSSNNEARTYRTVLSIMIHALHFISPPKVEQDWILPEEISERSILALNLIKNFQKHHEAILNTLNSNLP